MAFLLPKIAPPPLLVKSSQNALPRFQNYPSSCSSSPSALTKLELPPLRDSAQDKPAAVQDKLGPAQDNEKKKRDEFYLNVGIAVRTLREDIPALFYKDLNYDIYRSSGRKVEEPELLEAIRLTIINNLLEYHPESSTQLAMGATFGAEPPKQMLDVDIATHIYVYEDGPDRSLLVVETADRPGLLVDLVQIITDINITVQSGEFDTERLLAKAKFHVSYRDKPISKPLEQVLANSLRYFLRRPTTEEASF